MSAVRLSDTSTYGRAKVACWWFNTREFDTLEFAAPYVVTFDLGEFGSKNFDAVVDDFGNLVWVPS